MTTVEVQKLIERVANLEKELGLDLPIYVQYLNWIGGLLRGDLGYAYVSEKPALEEILPTLAAGATLVMRGDALWETEELARRVEALGLTVLNPFES